MASPALVTSAPADLPLWLDAAASLLLIGGGVFSVIGSIGLVRLRDFAMRLHAPTKASTLGVGGVLLASMLCFGWYEQRVPIHELLITLFVFMTAPVSAHLMIKASLDRDRTPKDESDGGHPPAGRPSGR